MDQPLVERRTDARFGHSSVADLRATLRPGCLVSVVDLSAGGVLVEGPRPLRPGARVHLQVVAGPRTFAVAAHILRCTVWAVGTDTGVLYRGALRFEHPCDLFGEDRARDDYALPGGPASSR